jgi:hypothetical protein
VVTLVATRHWSARNLSDRNMSLWASFVIEAPGGRVYFVADSGYGDGSHFRKARERHGPFKLAEVQMTPSVTCRQRTTRGRTSALVSILASSATRLRPGGGFGLGFNSRTATDTRSELGARFDRLLLLNPNAALTMRARVAWAHDWVSDPTLAAVFQPLPGASFIVNGATPAKNSALTSAGAELRLANGLTLVGKFDGEFASHSSTYAGTGTVRYTW